MTAGTCLRIVGGEKCIPGSTTNLGQGELDTPDLTLVLQAILADELQLGVAV